MRRILYLLLLSSIPALSLSSQVLYDQCTDAIPLVLSAPSPCPQAQSVVDRFELSLTEATATVPFPSLSGCSGENGLPDIWASFTPAGNELTLQIDRLENGQFVLFTGVDCDNMYPVACGSDTDNLSAEVDVEPGLTYFLLMGGDLSDDSSFELTIESRNDCSSCQTDKQGFFTASPAPVNGAYQGGEEVQLCFTVAKWGTSFSDELLHGIEVAFGQGWIVDNLDPTAPNSCSIDGAWQWFDNWESEATGEAFGPGFAFDTYVLGSLNGNPGDNHGLNGDICSNIGYASPPIQFCWTLNVPACTQGVSELNSGLDVEVRMLGDGLSGNNPNGNCFSPPPYHFLATQDCYDPLAPTLEVQNASCIETCDGQIDIQGGGEGPWDYIVTNSSNVLVYISTGVNTPAVATGLCPGDYTVTVIDASSSTTTTNTVTIGAASPIEASAEYDLPCFEGEPIQLFGYATPDDPNAVYTWTGPNGFTADSQNPLAFDPGAYTLVVSANGCNSQPYTLEVPPLDLPFVEIAEDTIVACPGDSLTITATGSAVSWGWLELNSGEMYGDTSSITVLPEDGALYYVNGTTADGCTGVDQVVITLTFEPELQSDVEGVICNGDAVSMQASGGNSYLWSTGDTTANLLVYPTVSTSYEVTITGEDSCSAVLSQDVLVATGSNLFVSPDTEICAGESATITANGSVSQVWNTGATSSTITVSPSETTTYTVVQTDQHGCTYESEVTVTVNADPQLVLSPADTSICPGESVRLVATTADSVLLDTVVTPQQSTTYELPFDFGCQSQAAFSVTVLPAPSVDIRPPATLCGADSVLLIAEGSGGTYLWSTGESGDRIYVAPADSTAYSVTLTSLQGCTVSDSITISALAAPDAPVIQCDATFDQITFSWAVDTSLTYSLIPVEGPLGEPVGNNEYVVNGLMPGDSVTVLLEVEDEQGCTSSSPATCYTQTCSDIDIFLAVPEQTCDSDGLVALLADVAGGTNEGEGQWSGPGVDPQANTFDPASTGPGTFPLVYAYRDGPCIFNDTTNITVEQAFSAAQVSCEASAGHIVFTWVPTPQDTSYEVEVLSGQSGSRVDEYTFRVDSLAEGDSVTVAITALGAGACGQTTVEFSCMAAAYECPPLSVSQDTFICEGETALLSAETEGWDTYIWSPAVELSCLDCPETEASPVSTTTYTVIAANASGCADTAEVTVFVEDFPTSYIPDTPIVFCPGEPFELCMPAGDIHYWIGPNAFISTDQCLTFDNPTADRAGRYYALMRKGGCRFIKLFELEAAPPIEVNAITDFQSVCPQDTFTLFVEAEGAIDYSWSLPQYLDCPTCPETTGQVPQTATFTVTMSDAYGCTVTANAAVFVESCAVPGAPGGNQALSTSVLAVFPNPATDYVEIRTQLEDEKEIQVWSLAGRLLKRQPFEGHQLTLPVHDLPNGQYVLRLISEQRTETRMMQIQR